MTRTISRLEKTYRRLKAQLACLAFAFDEIRDREGVVAELGLGHGRTFDHLRRSLPAREIFAFDFEDKAYEDCRPAPEFFIGGDIFATFPAFAQSHRGRIVLVNCDLGSFDTANNAVVAARTSRLVPPAVSPGGIIMSDLPLDSADCETLPLPEGIASGYYLYRRRG